MGRVQVLVSQKNQKELFVAFVSLQALQRANLEASPEQSYTRPGVSRPEVPRLGYPGVSDGNLTRGTLTEGTPELPRPWVPRIGQPRSIWQFPDGGYSGR